MLLSFAICCGVLRGLNIWHFLGFGFGGFGMIVGVLVCFCGVVFM